MTRLKGKPTVLVVEDEYFLADDVAAALAAAGAEVLGPVPTPAAALDVLKQHPRIDFALLDINLRGTMAYGVADELRRRGIPFVFATGYDAQAIIEEYRYVPQLAKPVMIETILEAVAEAAEHSRA
ncbi:response regulator [Devosia sp. A16]|uniref:response regulator n=1 Tax=Devosia sp. A16 TaxID=1736675 RepID=UPI0006D78ED0|nr:response regulator [Devosia sp. A16]